MNKNMHVLKLGMLFFSLFFQIFFPKIERFRFPIIWNDATNKIIFSDENALKILIMFTNSPNYVDSAPKQCSIVYRYKRAGPT